MDPAHPSDPVPRSEASPFVRELVQIAWHSKPKEVGFEKRFKEKLSARFDDDFLEGGKFTAVEATALRLRIQLIEKLLESFFAALRPLKDDLKPIQAIPQRQDVIVSAGKDLIRKRK